MVTAVCAFIFLLLTLNQRHPGAFPHAGSLFVNAGQAPADLLILTESAGYDGQFYYRLALDPLTRKQTDFGIEIDNPRYRQQRILYPLLAWLFSFGSPPLVANALILVNFLALVTIGYVAGLFAKNSHRHALWGLAFSLYPGFLLSLSRDLAEITEAALVLAGLVFVAQKRNSLAAALLSLAILAKETALLTAVSLLAQRKYWRLTLLPVVTFAGWQLILNEWWGDSLQTSIGINFGWPLLGILQGFTLANDETRWLIEVSLLAVFFGCVLFSLQTSDAERHLKVAWALYFGLMLLLTKHVWLEDWAFLRAATPGFMLGTAVLLKTRTWVPFACFLVTIAAWLWLATDLLTP